MALYLENISRPCVIQTSSHLVLVMIVMLSVDMLYKKKKKECENKEWSKKEWKNKEETNSLHQGVRQLLLAG